SRAGFGRQCWFALDRVVGLGWISHYLESPRRVYASTIASIISLAATSLATVSPPSRLPTPPNWQTLASESPPPCRPTGQHGFGSRIAAAMVGLFSTANLLAG